MSGRIHDRRGNNQDRKARKLWMLRTWDLDLPAWLCRCVHCAEVQGYDSVQADRIKPGGSYRRGNVQPSCASCNRQRSDDVTWIHPNRQHKQLTAAA